MKSVIRKDEAAVSPVIATILMVAITVVLAAVLYVMVSGLITPVGGNKPLVTFSAVDQNSGNATIVVAGASQSVSPSNYKVNLQVGTNTGTAVAMPTTGGLFATLTVGAPAVTYRIYWTDIGGEKTVNSGDNFRVTGNNVALPAATSFTFYLLWSDGSSIQSTPWSTP
jgi:flagellin-like protein